MIANCSALWAPLYVGLPSSDVHFDGYVNGHCVHMFQPFFCFFSVSVCVLLCVSSELDRAQRLEERERILREIWMNGQPDISTVTQSLNRYYWHVIKQWQREEHEERQEYN